MPVPSAITDLSTTLASNSPAGSDNVFPDLDNYLRAHAQFVALLRDGRGLSTEVSLASAATCDIGGAASMFVQITGTTTITSFGTNYLPRILRFAGVLTLTHNATTLILPTGANITTAAGDMCLAVPVGTSGWRVLQYQRASEGADFVSFLQAGTGASSRTVQSKLRDVVSVKDFGAVGDGIVDDTAAIWNAIVSLRANPVSILDTIGGSLITAYSSGVVFFPPGIYKVSADQLQISQDLGLTLRGSGSRRTNNAVRASTTLLVSGTSSGFGIQAYRNGGRGLTIEDMDVCYETSGFTGSLLDDYDSPGLTCNRVFFGTYGITGGTRLQTAAACVRSTYDEFMTFNNCVFDGAVDGWWSDDTRTAFGNSFGGSNTFFNNCVFYDFTGSQVRHDGNRTRTGVSLYGCAFNPISVNCVRSVNFTNIEGLCIDTNHFTPSTTFKASTEWMKASNCTGSIVNNSFDDLSKAGTIDGMLNVFGNRVFSTDGFTATGGVITGRSNEFSQGTNGWTISPTYGICVDLGPDLFKVGVTGRSYDIPADSANLAGRINYDSASDSSASKFRNTSGRIQIANVDGKSFAVSSTPYTVSILDTGRTILATGGSAQTFTLPTPTPGTTITITKLSSVNLNVNCAGGTNYYGVGTAAYTGAALTGATFGTLVLEAYATVGWIVKSQVNSWTFT